jgi:pyruvate dehydrogenase E2 component (dihydrolipoamide acetyltransferase)
MDYLMKMPDLATTDSAIKVVGWRKKPGDAVAVGEIVLDVETDKAAMEVESTVKGVVKELRVAPGAEVFSGEVLALFDVADAAPTPAPSSPKLSLPAPEPTPRQAGGMFARNRQAKQGSASGAEAVVLGPARRTAAQRLVQSKQQAPHFYLEASACAEGLVAKRNAQAEPKPAWDAYFVKAISNALKDFPQMGMRYANDSLVPSRTTAIGVAVDVEGELFVVQVESPESKEIVAISADIRAGVGALRSGDPAARLQKPGVLTISNLGSTGIERFSAIINPPEAAILAVGSVKESAVASGGSVRCEWRVALTLSVDHRVVNGLYAARFLAAIVKQIENI